MAAMFYESLFSTAKWRQCCLFLPKEQKWAEVHCLFVFVPRVFVGGGGGTAGSGGVGGGGGWGGVNGWGGSGGASTPPCVNEVLLLSD